MTKVHLEDVGSSMCSVTNMATIVTKSIRRIRSVTKRNAVAPLVLVNLYLMADMAYKRTLRSHEFFAFSNCSVRNF